MFEINVLEVSNVMKVSVFEINVLEGGNIIPEETKIGKEISVVSHPVLLNNYEIYVRPKRGCD